MPSGFAPIEDTILRQASGGKFVTATANWYGKGKPKEMVEFFQKALPPKGWVEEESNYYDDSGFISFVSKGKNQSLSLSISQMDPGFEIAMELVQN
jgi:hypothetical protein